MKELNCEYVRDVYPDVLNGSGSGSGSGRLGWGAEQQVRAHLAACEDCRAEAAVLELLHAQRLVAPEGLDTHALTALARSTRSTRVPRHALALAASVAIALVGGSVLLQIPARTAAPVAVKAYGFVGVEDAMLSGKASLNDLSEAELELLLQEMES